MSNGAIPEEFVLEDGEGLIDIRGDGFDFGLLVGGEPVAFIWADCHGSIGEYLIRSRDTSNLSGRLRAMRQVAGGELNPETPLHVQIRPLLALFTNGRYQLVYQDEANGFQIRSYDKRFSYARDGENFYPEPPLLVMTQPMDLLRRDRIDFFRERIAAGIRPIVFAATLGRALDAFVLDGHHKLQAYRELEVLPAVLFIVKVTPDPIPLEDGVRFFAPGQPLRDEYRRVKSEYGGIITEADWLRCTRLYFLLNYVRERASERRRRLLSCAYCRHIWHQMGLQNQQVVEVAERFADGLATNEELAASREITEAAGAQARVTATPTVHDMARGICLPTVEFRIAFSPAQRAVEVPLARDVFGNPFRPVAIDPAWLAWNNQMIPRLAQAAYDARSMPAGTLDVARLGVLADALEDAGCTETAILEHLRGPGPHVRGCWPVDLLLGKQ